ncbi:hypothetical protein, partial [Rhizobium sp.]|uniref:hypothetical protein n=1 Tax=Rhizobium sp. TaxID=391 RepID=UPI002AA855C9
MSPIIVLHATLSPTPQISPPLHQQCEGKIINKMIDFAENLIAIFLIGLCRNRIGGLNMRARSTTLARFILCQSQQFSRKSSATKRVWNKQNIDIQPASKACRVSLS